MSADGGQSPTPSLVDLDRSICGDLDAAVRREWLVTNGLGGYAFGSLAGMPTRSYHGTLVAALAPPVDRTVVVGGLVERVRLGRGRGRTVRLDALERATVEGGASGHLARFRLDGMLPAWTFEIDRAAIERRLWMPYGRNATLVRYDLAAGAPVSSVELDVVVLVTARDHHATEPAEDGRPRASLVDAGRVRVALDGPRGAIDLAITTDHGRLAVEGPGLGRWISGIRLREETARGQADRTRLFAAARLRATLRPGAPVTLALATPPSDGLLADPAASLAAARDRQAALIRQAGAESASPPVRQLVLAADQFLVQRPLPVRGGGSELGRTVIAGYPWFNDWGRDTMLALPGLTLATGRLEEAATILRSFARFVRDGLVPNSFPDHDGEEVAYHTADASLLFILAIAAYEEATRDRALVAELLPASLDILDRHRRGTRFGIGLDPADGLLRAGAKGHQLTWMDAKVGGWVVTPRRGKPVEVQAYWINALRITARWLRDRGRAAEAADVVTLADRAARSFGRRFWRPELGYLADVVDGPDGDDTSLRPNQLLALSLPHPLLDPASDAASSVLEACRRHLLTPGGLRSLAPVDAGYRSRFQGDRLTRDGAYHQGTVWSWLIGPYVDAVLRVAGDRDHAREVLVPFVAHLSDAGLGTISECFEPEPPFEPRACVAQAWGVAEVLRQLRRLEAA